MEAQNVVAQSCPTFCHPMGYSPPGSFVHGILKARILEWVAISFPWGSFHPGIKPGPPTLQADSLQSEPQGDFLICIVFLFGRFFFLSALQIYHLLPPGPQDCC